jgi:hypothetical protein
MNKEIMKKLNKAYSDVDEEIKEFIDKKNREREHATEVAEACQKAYDKFIEAFKSVISDNSEHEETEEWSDIFTIKDSTGNPIYKYCISVSIFFLSDKWIDDDDDESYYDASEMKINVYFESPLSEHMGKMTFEYEMSGDGEMIFQPSDDLKLNLTFDWSLPVMLGFDNWDNRVFEKIRRSDEFTWEHLAQYQCQMLKLELALLDYGKLLRFKTNYDGIDIPYDFVETFNCLTDRYYWYNEKPRDFENEPELSRLKAEVRIRECSELIKSARPFMEHFHIPHFKQRLMDMAAAACKLGLHEDQLIITEFVNTIPDPSDKWEL